jgi:hypothetical protein
MTLKKVGIYVEKQGSSPIEEIQTEELKSWRKTSNQIADDVCCVFSYHVSRLDETSKGCKMHIMHELAGLPSSSNLFSALYAQGQLERSSL